MSLVVSCHLDLIQPTTAMCDEKPECLQAQALLRLIAEAVYLLLSLHLLVLRLQACHWLSVSGVKWAIDGIKQRLCLVNIE